MAVLGTFTPYHFGMMLDYRVNLFHWFLVPPAWAIGLVLLRSRPRPSPDAHAAGQAMRMRKAA